MTIKTTLSRRRFLGNASTMAAASAITSTSMAGAPKVIKKKRPNVLFIMSDQERNFTTLPKDLDLPAHEYLLKHGVGFENYYVNTSPCSPSRSVIYSGQHTMKTGVVSNLHAPPFIEYKKEMKTLGHYLQEQGYYTAYKGKWHLTSIEDGPGLMYGAYPSRENALQDYGFNDFNLTGDVHGSVWAGRKMDNIIASEACDWLRQRNPKDEQPWCLSVNFVNPHDIMFYSTGQDQANSRLSNKFMAPIKGKPSHPLYKKDWSHVGLPNSFKDNLKNKPFAHQSFAGVLDTIYGSIDKDNEAAWLDMQSYYFNCLRDVSRQVDQVISQLAATGELDNTIIIYTADHGEMAGAHGLRQKGPFPYKENSNVPLIIKHPDIKQASTHKQLGSSVDIVPTILEMVGMDKKDIHDQYPQLVGVSLADTLSGGKSERDDIGHLFAYGVVLYIDPDTTKTMIESEGEITPVNLLAENIRRGKLLPDTSQRALHRGIFDGRYKFTRYFAADSHHIPDSLDMLKQHNDLELYDTLNDPDEMINLAQGANVDWSLVASLNNKTNALIKHEIGDDFGQELAGPDFLYKLKV